MRLITHGSAWDTGAKIQVLDENWDVVETITNEDLKPVV
jgi:hypothetical protein